MSITTVVALILLGVVGFVLAALDRLYLAALCGVLLVAIVLLDVAGVITP